MLEQPKLVPIRLNFYGVGYEEIIEITLSTPGVTWSVGSAELDEVGFSLNSLVPSDSPPVFIHRMELGEVVLAIQTSEKNATIKTAADQFSIDLFLLCQGDIERIEGACTINAGAKVVVSLPLQQPIEWRRGPISATLMERISGFEAVRLVARGLGTGNSISLHLEPRSFSGRNVRWSLGPSHALGGGLRAYVPDGSLIGLPQLSMTASTIQLVYQPQSTVASPGFLMLELSVQIDGWASQKAGDTRCELDSISLMVVRPSTVSVLAQIGTHLPKLVVDSFTPFPL